MFKDYYQILGITPQATDSEIKMAYRKMSMKWHPDRNPDSDVTSMMQDINEAYAILKDASKRKRYDLEYDAFIQHKQKGNSKSDINTPSWVYNYNVQDSDLKEDIKNAREYAKGFVEEFFRSLKKDSQAAVQGAWDNAKGYVYAAIFLTIIGGLIRSCISM